MLDPWIGFLNEQVAKRPPLDRSLGREFLRETILEHAANSFPFPLDVSFRGVVVGQSELDGRDYLVVGPAGLTGDALRVLGGVLVPSTRDLFPGAVVDVRCSLEDPDNYDRSEGLLARTADVRVIVPLER